MNKVRIANGLSPPIAREASSSLTHSITMSNILPHSITMSDVLHVLELTQNLLSANKITRNLNCLVW